jgi:hypothetical protein
VKLVVLAQRAEDFAALEGAAEVSHLLLCEGGPKAEALALRLGATLHTLEEVEQRRRCWSNADMDALAEAFANLLSNRVDVTVLPYSTSSALEGLRDRTLGPVRVLAPSARLKAALDDKQATRVAFRKLGLPTIDTIRVGAGSTFDRLALRLGLPFVLQHVRSSGGTGTFVISSSEDFEECRSGIRQSMIASRHVGTQTVNVHGFVLKNRVHVSPMSIQLTCVGQVAHQTCLYGGNDFAAIAHLDGQSRVAIAGMTTVVGAWIRQMGWWGVFGMDFRVGHDGIWPLEVNPRFQGSSWVLAEAEIEAGTIPLAARQIGLRHRSGWLDWQSVINRSLVIERQRPGLAEDRSASGLALEAGAVRARRLLVGSVTANCNSPEPPRSLLLADTHLNAHRRASGIG